MSEDNASLRLPASYRTTYGHSKIEHVTVEISEHEYIDLVKQAAIKQVKLVNVAAWHCDVEFYEGEFGDYQVKVTFQREMNEEESSEP